MTHQPVGHLAEEVGLVEAEVVVLKLGPDEETRLVSERGRLEGDAVEGPAGQPDAFQDARTQGRDRRHGRGGCSPVVLGGLRSHGRGHRLHLRFWILRLHFVQLVL